MTDHNAVPSDSGERPPVESEAIDERDIEPMGEGHVESDPVPHPEMPPPSYEADQGVGGRDAHPGGGTDVGNRRTEDEESVRGG